jgi:hypothetical protein
VNFSGAYGERWHGVAEVHLLAEYDQVAQFFSARFADPFAHMLQHSAAVALTFTMPSLERKKSVAGLVGREHCCAATAVAAASATIISTAAGAPNFIILIRF